MSVDALIGDADDERPDDTTSELVEPVAPVDPVVEVEPKPVPMQGTPIACGPMARIPPTPPDPVRVFEQALRNVYSSGGVRTDITDLELAQAERDLTYESRDPRRYRTGW